MNLVIDDFYRIALYCKDPQLKIYEMIRLELNILRLLFANVKTILQ